MVKNNHGDMFSRVFLISLVVNTRVASKLGAGRELVCLPHELLSSNIFGEGNPTLIYNRTLF